MVTAFAMDFSSVWFGLHHELDTRIDPDQGSIQLLHVYLPAFICLHCVTRKLIYESEIAVFSGLSEGETVTAHPMFFLQRV